MSKKILFIISNLETGGVSKSMTSLMNVIDRERYDVSLMIVSSHGALMSLLPSDLKIITNPIWQALVSGAKGFLELLRMREPILAIGHIYRLALSVFSKSAAGRMIAMLMPGIDEEFDTIVDFNGQHQLYYMVNKIKARKRVTFFHSDYAKWAYYYKADKKYFPKVDRIFTVSEHCVASLKEYFPKQSNKIDLMENISSLELIERMGAETIDDMEASGNILLTIGHVCENKGILWAIEAASFLKKRGVDFHWYFIGAIDNPTKYNELIVSRDVEDVITFMGIRVNPYPYIRKSTVIVHPSKFEGKSIALDEVKLLCKPVVVTNFSTVHDQFKDRENASICDMNGENIADAIEELLNNSLLRQKYINNLKRSRRDNSIEIEKLYAIFDE